jgi:hypothetical protein
MTKKFLFVFTLLLAVAFVAAAADVSGNWTYDQPGRGGGNPTTITITLKADGSTLTGSVMRPGRGGAAGTPMQISDGKVDGSTVTFTTKREGQNGTVVTTYKGTLKGDTLELEITAPGRGGDPMTNKFSAKRATT